MKLGRAEKPPVYRVTSARRGLREDVGARERRYVVTMSVRTLCLLLAVVVHGPLRFVCVAAAVVLPYIAVVFANGGREPAGPDLPAITNSAGPRALGPGGSPGPA
jgi:hypothetical protein